MSSRSTAPEKRPGFFAQLRSLFTFTKAEFAWLPWALIAIVVVAVALGVLVGFLVPPVAVWSIILWAFTGLMLGVLGAMILLTRLSTRAMYKKLDGMPGHRVTYCRRRSDAAGWLPRCRSASIPRRRTPSTASSDAGRRARRGGARGRLTRLVNDEKMKVQRVASGVPITVLYVGHGEGDVEIAKLASSIKSLPKKVDRATMAAVVKRVDSVSQSVTSLPIPKGIDPMRARRRARAEHPAHRPCGLGLSAQQHRSSGLVVQTALIGIPDHRGNDEAEQDRADDRPPQAHPAAADQLQAHTEQAVTRASAERRQERDLHDREDDGGRERVVGEERDRHEDRARPVDREGRDAPSRTGDAARPDLGKTETLAGIGVLARGIRHPLSVPATS
jgi:hypothetical protein